MGALQIIPPLTITDTRLTSSNVAETDYSAWSNATTYSLGQRVIVTTGVHKIYESLQASNLNHDPTTSPTWWIEVSATNRWKMFDSRNDTSTTNPNTIDITITPGSVVNSVALFGLVGTSVRIKMTDPTDGVVYDTTFSLSDSGTIGGWYRYFFDPIYRRTVLTATNLPAYGSASIQIIVTYTGNTAQCSTCVLGLRREVGEGINLGASVGITDYSRKEKDTFGNYVLVRRGYSKRMNVSMAVLNTEISSLQNLLADLRTTPCVWIGDPDYENLIIYGYYKDFDIVINYHLVSDVNLQIEGLI